LFCNDCCWSSRSVGPSELLKDEEEEVEADDDREEDADDEWEWIEEEVEVQALEDCCRFLLTSLVINKAAASISSRMI